MFRYALAALLLCSITLTSIGCGSSRSPRPKPPKSIFQDWKAADAFFAPEVMEEIDMPASLEDYVGMAKNLKSPAFKTALDAFNAAALPSGWDGEAQKTAKDAVVAKFTELITEANGDADTGKLKTLYEAAQAAVAVLNKSKPN